MGTVIEARGLVKRYRTRKGPPAIEDLNLSMPSGQLYGLVGPDGAGKTTTLRILSTVMEASAGTANVAGYDVKTDRKSVV